MGSRYEQLSFSERVYVQAQLELGFKAAAIAAALKTVRRRSISRELRRNGWKRPGCRHRQERRRSRRAVRLSGRPGAKAGGGQSRHTPGSSGGWFRARRCGMWWIDNLRAGMSPEQIAGTLKRMGLPRSRPSVLVPRGNLSSYLRHAARRVYGPKLSRCCARVTRKRRTRARGKDRRGQIPDVVPIHERPAGIEERGYSRPLGRRYRQG